MSKYHESVMAIEAIEHLKVKKDHKYIDCTLGDGGHTLQILRLGGIVLSLDQDINAIERVKKRLEEETLRFEGKLFLHHGNFKDLREIAEKYDFRRVDGILYDLGTSFLQLEDLERGFSFRSNEILDMRMDQTQSLMAKDLVNGLSEKELAALIYTFGEDSFSKTIAKAIVKARKEKAIETGVELATIIEKVKPRFQGTKIHPATKTFQALRIAINNELENFQTSVNHAEDLLNPGGRLVIISFHSLEDRIAKELKARNLKQATKKPILPSAEEIDKNSRSRSAKMRVFEKI